MSETNAEFTQFVVFSLDNEEYALPILEVKEIVNFQETTPVPDSMDFVIGVINLRGKIIPIIDLEKRFGLIRNTPNKQGNVIITEFNNDLAGITVDSVSEVLKIDKNLVKDQPALISQKIASEYIKSVIVIEALPEHPERIILILNLSQILSMNKVAENSQIERPL